MDGLIQRIIDHRALHRCVKIVWVTVTARVRYGSGAKFDLDVVIIT